jgi:IS605 OrfB family transposase
MSIKTRNIKLVPVGTKEENKKVYKYFEQLSKDLAKIGNELIRIHVGNQYALDDLVKDKNLTKGEAIKIFQENIGMSIMNQGYDYTKKYNYIPSAIRTAFNSTIYKTIQKNFWDMVNGKMSIPSFRCENMTIPFNIPSKLKDKFFNIENEKHNIFLPITKEIKEQFPNGIKLNLFYGRDKSNNKVIVERIINGEYKLKDSTFTFKKEDNEIYINLTYEQPKSVGYKADDSKIMGVDVGINRPVSFFITNLKHQPYQISIGEKIQHERIKKAKHRRSLQQGLAYGKGGHGRKRKTKAQVNLKQKESNWAKTMNHVISKKLIEIAVENNVSVIKMEDLTNISKNTKKLFLKTWGYFQLQNFIEYKAKTVGIKIEWVDPKYTSQTCPICGETHKENRNEEDKTIFACTNSNCKDYQVEKDADVNASINIVSSMGYDVKPKSKAGRIAKAKEKKKTVNETV